MWIDTMGFHRHDDEEYDAERDKREALERQDAIDRACYSPDPTEQYLNRRRYYDSLRAAQEPRT